MRLLPSSIFHAACLVFMQIIVINYIRGAYSTPYNNATNSVSQRESGRSKRSLGDLPLEIKIRIAYSADEFTGLELVKLDTYLANKHLPVIMSSGYLDTHVMSNVGDFVVYRDTTRCSVVVYFEELNALFGYIGLDYFITNLPYKFDVNTGYYPGVVGEPYLIKRSDAPVHIFPLLSEASILRKLLQKSNDDTVGGIKRPLDSDEGPTSKHQRTERDLAEENYATETDVDVTEISHIRKRRWDRKNHQYYLETLVFVTRGVVEKFEKSVGANDYMEWIVRYCIIYFSAVDMIFQKIRKSNLKLRVNIARIVIEDDLEPFHFMRDNDFQFTQTITKLRRELSIFSQVYVPDSFDHVFAITSDPIMLDSVSVPAMSQYYSDLYSKKQESRLYNAVPITVIHSEADYAVAVHEISQTLSIQTDFPHKGLEHSLQCSSIMQEGSSKCNRCLRWNDDSQEQFNVFFSENRNRCFLLNQPRSLNPPGPRVYSTPYKQCRCFGYASHAGSAVQGTYVRVNECDVPVQCRKIDGDRSYLEDALLPFDGTACGNRNKVCWGGRCTHYKNSYCTALSRQKVSWENVHA